MNTGSFHEAQSPLYLMENSVLWVQLTATVQSTVKLPVYNKEICIRFHLYSETCRVTNGLQTKIWAFSSQRKDVLLETGRFSLISIVAFETELHFGDLATAIVTVEQTRRDAKKPFKDRKGSDKGTSQHCKLVSPVIWFHTKGGKYSQKPFCIRRNQEKVEGTSQKMI